MLIIHFDNGTASRPVTNANETIRDILLGASRLQPYREKLNQMILWRMTKDHSETWQTRFDLGSVAQTDLAENYMGQHLQFSSVDDTVKREMRLNQAQHTAAFLYR